MASLPNKWSEDLVDETGQPMSKSYVVLLPSALAPRACVAAPHSSTI